MKYCLAIDIGASSGRHIVGWQENGNVKTDEVYRFPNIIHEENGHLVWDVRRRYSHVVRGVLEAFKAYPEIAEAVGGNCKVVLCATHDTGSAVEGIPMEGNHPYISSGTWSLLGVKTPKPITDVGSEKANYSNEGGVGYNRYQINIMGMWLVNELQRNSAWR